MVVGNRIYACITYRLFIYNEEDVMLGGADIPTGSNMKWQMHSIKYIKNNDEQQY